MTITLLQWIGPLVGIGIFAVIAYYVNRKRHEEVQRAAREAEDEIRWFEAISMERAAASKKTGGQPPYRPLYAESEIKRGHDDTNAVDSSCNVMEHLCTCGHPCNDHHFFNGDLVGCYALGTYATSWIDGALVRHQPIARCGCRQFEDARATRRGPFYAG